MILLIGKTTSGKTTLLNTLTKIGYKGVITYTTRPIRPGEIDGVTYHYISKEEFLEKKANGFFAETTSYNVANEETWYYGTAKKDLLNPDSVIIMNPQGFETLKSIPDLDIVSFYLKIDNSSIMHRLKDRGDDFYEGMRRMIADQYDFHGIENKVDFVLKNDLGINPTLMSIVIHMLYENIRRKKDKNEEDISSRSDGELW